jgi:two-component system response regulator GlrR
VTGETGVGKGRLAKWLHANSPRRKAPFVPVNCGAIPESIVDSQLFGHVRGAFTGATADHLGLVRAAESGTLFLDEVGELPNSAQTRLLRLLQEREIQPLGHPRPVVVDVRVMAATNSDLEAAVADKRFREDLLYRLDVVRLHVDALRNRRDELSSLIEEFNGEFAELYRQPEIDFDAAAMEILRTYRWPGNIRQLRTVVERLHVLCPGERVGAERLIEIGQIGQVVAAETTAPSTSRHSLDRARSAELRRVLRDNGGSVSQAAAVFGVHRSTIYRWLQSHGATADEPRA